MTFDLNFECRRDPRWRTEQTMEGFIAIAEEKVRAHIAQEINKLPGYVIPMGEGAPEWIRADDVLHLVRGS